MKKFTNCVLLTFVIFVALLNAINAKNDVLDTNAVNNQGNSVRIDFMDLKRVEFMEQLPLVKSTIAKYLTDYCRDDSNNCREITRTNFTGDSIEFFGGSDKERYHEEGRFVVSHINAKLTSLDDSGADLGYLSKESMEDFMTKYREQIVKDTSVPIAFINKKLVYPQRGNIDNYIIVSVSCAFCLFLIIFNLICQRKMSKQMKEALNPFKTLKEEPIEKSPKEKSNLTPLEEKLKQSRDDLEKSVPLLRNEDDQNVNFVNQDQNEPGRYLEPVDPFPIPSKPITATNKKYVSNIRTNPHMRLTQV